MAEDVWLVSGLRTPIGSLSGALASVPAPQLAATCIRAALTQAGIGVTDELVDEVILGNVISAGLGQNPARQATFAAGLPASVGATTVNKVCGSGLKAVMLAAQAIRLGDAQVVVAGGMENMSAAPYLLPRARQGYRLGHAEILDSIIQDGLWDVYGQQHMGTYGERCAALYYFGREAQDEFAIRSYQWALEATAHGYFQQELVPVEFTQKGKVVRVDQDEEPQRFNEAKLRALKPAFHDDGTVTAGNASSLNDGAAALVLASQDACTRHRLNPLARVVGAATFSQQPEWFTTAPIGALRKLLDKVGWSVVETDLFEVNEAFSSVAMAAAADLHIPAEKLNIHGGAVALGHPIGASGARILVTLLHALIRTGGRRGIATLCIGGGEAVAVAIERPA